MVRKQVPYRTLPNFLCGIFPMQEPQMNLSCIWRTAPERNVPPSTMNWQPSCMHWIHLSSSQLRLGKSMVPRSHMLLHCRMMSSGRCFPSFNPARRWESAYGSCPCFLLLVAMRLRIWQAILPLHGRIELAKRGYSALSN